MGLNNVIISAQSQETLFLVSLLTVRALLIKTQTCGCAFLHLPSVLWVEYVKFHNSVKSLSLCLFDSKTRQSALTVSEVENPRVEGEKLECIWWSMAGCHRGTFLRVLGITEKPATCTLSSFAIVSLQLTVCIVCRIRSGETSPTGPLRDPTATGTGLNPAQHVL